MTTSTPNSGVEIGNSLPPTERVEKDLSMELGSGPVNVTPPSHEDIYRVMCANLTTNAKMGKSLPALWMQLDLVRWAGYHPEQVVNVAATQGKTESI